MRHYLTRLRQWLHFSNLKGNYHFIIIFIILIFLTITSSKPDCYLIGILLLAYIFFLFLKHKVLCLITIIISSLIFLHFICKELHYNNAILEVNKNLVVKEITNEEDYQKVLLSDGEFKYLYYNKETTHYVMRVGDIYKIDAKVIKQDHRNIPNGFDYANHLKHQNILGVLEVEDIFFKRNIFVLSKINYWLENYYDNNFENASIIKALVIGKKTGISDNLANNIQMIGISHLFVVSGLHVGMLSGALEAILKKTKLNEKKKNVIIYTFLGLYLTITNFMVSVIRVSLGYVLKKILKYDFTLLDRIVINMLIVLLINPYYIFSYSFILTYLISSMIIAIGPMLLKQSSKSLPKVKKILMYILNMMIISISSIIITLPIVVNINSNINIMSIIYNIFYIPFVSYILLPLSIVLSILPFLENIFSFVYISFIFSINILSKFDFLSFSFPILSNIGNLVYYILIIFVINMVENKKWYFSFIFLIYLFLWYNKVYFTPFDKVTFLDVAEGDATHIQTSFNKLNIIIDTGISTDDSVITYLQKKGIRKIDLIIISHGDNDHNGNLDRLLKEFKVNHVIISAYDYSSYQIIVDNNFSHYSLVKRKDEFKLGNVYFEIIWPNRNTNDVNNNSLVFKMSIDDTSFLFTGDIEKKAEEEIIDLEKNIDVNVLKIAHHGSNTSTHAKWLNNTEFDVGIVMAGNKNPFGFPNQYTVERLKNFNIYYTSECDSITFSKLFFKKKWQIHILRDE